MVTIILFYELCVKETNTKISNYQELKEIKEFTLNVENSWLVIE